MENLQNQFNENREAWNKKTAVHVESEFYNLNDFKNGVTSLKSIELGELGDISNKKLLHIQCHFGQDTLSLARLGASVTGVDFSEAAITYAKNLSREINVPAEFICSNVYELRKHTEKIFDIVFTSYGVIGWLPDINEWAKIISTSLKPGGIFYMVEFHPFIWTLDDNFEKFYYSYFHSEIPLEFDVKGTYADRNADISYKNFNWIHSLSDVIMALKNNGLELEFFHEFPYSVYNVFPNMEPVDNEKWVLKSLKDTVPYLFSIKAVKK